MNVSLEILMIVLAISGITMIISGWRAAINANNCPNTKKSAIKSARTALAIGTVLFTMSFFYFIVLILYTKSNEKLHNVFNRKSTTKLYIILGIMFILSISGISLASVIMNGTGKYEDGDGDNEEKNKNACSKMKSGGVVILVPSIIILLLCLLYFYLYLK